MPTCHPSHCTFSGESVYGCASRFPPGGAHARRVTACALLPANISIATPSHDFAMATVNFASALDCSNHTRDGPQSVVPLLFIVLCYLCKAFDEISVLFSHRKDIFSHRNFVESLTVVTEHNEKAAAAAAGLPPAVQNGMRTGDEFPGKIPAEDLQGYLAQVHHAMMSCVTRCLA